jgi:lipopolysaccharide export system protein LptA
MIRARHALVLAAALCLGGPDDAAAQGLASFGGGGDTPIEIYAENGIEWQQDQLVFLARGNARAVRGELEVFADELRAYYRENGRGGSDIWRLDAKGNVRIVSPGEEATGDHAVYDVDNQILVLKGDGVRFVTDQDIITAERQLEYWEAKQMAVARGDALATRADRTINAEVLAAYFKKMPGGTTEVFRIDAFDDVEIETDQDQAFADRGVYNVESGIATLSGSVKIKRGANVLDGCSAQVNLKTGISKLFSCRDGSKRVQGLIQAPKKNAQ